MQIMAFMLAATQATVPTFSTSVNMVHLDVVVQDDHGHYITDIPQSAFVVYENGVKQDISYFTHEPVPIDLTLMIDGSDSMGPQLKDAYQAASRLVATIQPNTVQIIQFSNFARVVQPPTDDMVQVQGGLAQLALFADEYAKLAATSVDRKNQKDLILRETLKEWLANRAMRGSTALYTAVYSASTYLHKLTAEDGASRRQIIVLLTDGDDTASSISGDTVVPKVAQLEIPVYSICLRGPSSSHDPQNTDTFLGDLAKTTGGSYTIISAIGQLVNQYRVIADDIQAQYRISYPSSSVAHHGEWQAIQVSIGRPGYTLRHKQGYFAPEK